MYNIERHEKILEILKAKKSCSVSELAKTLSFSEATIRRDLNDLKKEMKIKKTFGGAVIIEKYLNEIPISVRRNDNFKAKEKIGRTAAELIHDNMTIFLSSSTTVEHLLPYLDRFNNITIITNSPEIPIKLSSTNANIYSTGGKFLHQSNSYVGEFARKTIRGLNADITFFSVSGMSNEGKLTISSTEDDIIATMMENSSKTCLLIDDSKFGKIFPYTLCNIHDVDIVISNNDLPENLNHNKLILAK